MYNELNDFRAAAQAAFPNETPERIQDAFAVYTHARLTNLEMLIVGRWVQNATEQFPGIDQSVRQNFQEMNELDVGGSVLNSDNWTLLANDAWILGGLHSQTPFYLASTRNEANIRGNNPNHPMSVTGRELIGVMRHGYQVVQGHPTLGDVARCNNPGVAANATFVTYRDAVNNAVVNNALTDDEVAFLTQAPGQL